MQKKKFYLFFVNIKMQFRIIIIVFRSKQKDVTLILYFGFNCFNTTLNFKEIKFQALFQQDFASFFAMSSNSNLIFMVLRIIKESIFLIIS